MMSLSDIRSEAAKYLTYALWAHIPVFLLLGILVDQDGLLGTALITAVVAAGPTAIMMTGGNKELHQHLAAAGTVLMPAILLYVFAGHPWQIDAHMYFFASLAFLATLCDARSVIIAAAVIAVHHLLFNFIMPAWVFPEGADLVRVIMHAVIVVLETAALFWVTTKLAATLDAASQAEAKAQSLAESAMSEAESAAAARAQAEEALQTIKQAEAEKQSLSEAKAEELRLADERAAENLRSLGTDMENMLRDAVNELTAVNTGLAAETDTLAEMTSETSGATSVATGATDNVSHNVSTVASSAEEMSASVSEIARQVSMSTEVVAEARGYVELSEQRIVDLSARADKINDVLKMIGDIAEQTNLLALNATIEAARAGDAGKGFAVVASEVKSLANQSANATDEIGSLLAGIREATDDAVDVNKKIVAVVGKIEENSNGIAAAVEEQSAATEEIARSAQSAAGDTVEASQAVRNLESISGRMSDVSSKTAEAVTALTAQMKVLDDSCGMFLARLKAS
ncbi:methyl-accepting chemotaxis protein [Kordiimonas aquimaris]|uniref:methyl-accepting chemotaxis protein n=1 Tax=Kordiimonas aquimaris TaxID=707591 RepID=UPI0021CF6637|nr:methyl-accepting chemotaxis protein [Kordiimonas aquimaris]